MDPKTKNLLPNLLYLKTLMEREFFFREMFAEFLCGLYMIEYRFLSGNGSHKTRYPGNPAFSPAEKNVSNPAESAVNRDTSPGDCLQINRIWFLQRQDLNLLIRHMGQVSNILYIILLNDD